MNPNNDQRRVSHSRRALLSVVAVAAIAGPGLPLTAAADANADEPEPMLMFVQIADDLKVDAVANTLRLVKVGQQTVYFSDRPVRLAGHLKMADYLDEWTEKAGEDNFGADPPNATLSVYEPGQPDNSLAVVETSGPKIDGSDLIYNYKLIDGDLPDGGGATTLFIDWIGVGVGVGFHGVGVGLRGPGFR